MEKKFCALIDEEIARLVKKYGAVSEVAGFNLDYDLHHFSVFVIKEYAKAISSVGEDAYEIERINK
jgi:hypothetical protein